MAKFKRRSAAGLWGCIGAQLTRPGAEFLQKREQEMISLKRLVWLLVMAGSLVAPPAWARGNLSPTLTVLVAPARYTMMQVGMDMIQRHYVVLVSYQGDAQTANPALHVWDGNEWRALTLDEFRTSSYLKYPPARMVLVGDEATLPSVLAEAAAEASRLVLAVPSQDTAEVVNAMGKVFSFKSSEWGWFARRYGLELSDENQELRSVSWYDKPHGRSGGEAVVAVPAPSSVAVIPREEDIPAATVVVDAPAEDAESAMRGWDESAETTDALPVK